MAPQVRSQLNVNSIYKHGYDAVSLTPAWHTRFTEIVKQTDWIADSSKVVLRNPSWASTNAGGYASKVEQEESLNADSLALAPQDLVAGVRELLEDRNLFGIWREAYKFDLSFIAMWDGAERLPWHWDGPTQAEFFFLIYLNQYDQWPAGGGGELIVGTRDIESGFLGFPKPEDVTVLDMITPQAGTVVCCNNRNPRFVHKVNPLLRAKERIVLMICFNTTPDMNMGRR